MGTSAYNPGSSFWGLNNAGKQDKAGLWQVGQNSGNNSQYWQGKASDYGGQGDENYQSVRDFYNNLLQNPGSTVSQNWDTARQIDPTLEGSLSDEMGRLSTLYGDWNNLQGGQNGTQGTIDQLNNWGDEMGGNITRNYGANADSISGSYKRANDLENSTDENVNRNISDVYSGLKNDAGTAYGNLEDKAAKTYGDLGRGVSDSFSNSRQILQGLQPGSQLLTGMVARNFAPQVASTAASLRASGVDPNSPQAVQAMNNVRRQQSEAMDTASGNALQNYINSGIGLNTQENQTKNALGQAGLNTQLGLGSTLAGLQLGYGQQGGDLTRQEMLQHGANLSGLDLGQAEKEQANNLGEMGSTNQYLQQRLNNALTANGLNLNAFNTNADLTNKMNEQSRYGETQRQGQYQRGFNQNAYNTGLQLAAASGLTGQEAQQYANEFAAGGLSNQDARTALDAYKQSLAAEGSNAGWGSQLLGGIIGGAMKFI